MDSFGTGRFSPMDKNDNAEKMKMANARINLERGEKARKSLQEAINQAFDESMSPDEIQLEIDLIMEGLKKRRNYIN